MTLIHKEYVFFFAAFCKESSKIHKGIEDVVIVANNTVSPKAHIKRHLKRADLMLCCVLYYLFPVKRILMGKQVKNGVIYPVKMPLCVRTDLGITVSNSFIKETYLISCGYRNRFKLKALLTPKGVKSLLSYCSCNSLGCKIKEFFRLALANSLYSRKNRGYCLAGTCWCLQKQLFPMNNSPVDCCRQVFLPLSVWKWKLHGFNGRSAGYCPLVLKIRPLLVLFYQIFEPGFDF